MVVEINTGIDVIEFAKKMEDSGAGGITSYLNG